MVNGYFDDNVPMEFWRLLALYISSNTLSSVYWAIPFGQDEVNTMLNQAKEVLSWYDNMRNPVPTWYFKGYYLQYIDGIPFKLKSTFDFSFMKEYGTVFKVYDDQDSGNICFGTEKDGQRYFVKFAGAPTEQYGGDPADAISRLKATLPIYSDLKHENLIELIEAKEMPILMKLRTSILLVLPLLRSLESITAHGKSGSSATSSLRSQREQ